MTPAFARACARTAEVEASIGVAEVAAALKIYRSRRGEYPTSLGELESLVPALPRDPFSGQPYIYRREASGFVVYSVGKDRRDHGGARDSLEDWRVLRVGK